MSNLLSIRARLPHPVPLAICCALLLLFGVLSYSAVRTKSATYDESMHAVGAWVHLHEHDFRINFEDPPLWGYWAALPSGRNAITINKDDANWTRMQENTNFQWLFSGNTLYHTPSNDGLAFLMRSRAMMVIAALALGAMILAWGWKLGGPIAAVIATFFFALDPNLIGHGALVKNDVPMALVMAAVFYSTWRVGRQLTWTNGLMLALSTAASVNVKFSALLFGPMLIVLLGIRVFLPSPWRVLGRELSSRAMKFAAAAVLLVAIGVISYVAIWACYGFRFSAAPDPSVELNTALYKEQSVRNTYVAAHPPQNVEPFDGSVPLDVRVQSLVSAAVSLDQAKTEFKSELEHAKLSDARRTEMQSVLEDMDKAETQALALRLAAQQFIINLPPPDRRDEKFHQNLVEIYRQVYINTYGLMQWTYEARLRQYWCGVGDEAPDRFIAMLNVLHNHRLLPSAWLHGVLFVHARSSLRGSYLLGEQRLTGWWYYFPLAMLFKTPVATLMALGVAAVIGIRLFWRRRADWKNFAWPLACLLVPLVIYMLSVMSANLNIGLRHVLCVYPFMYIPAAVLLARKWTPWNPRFAIPLLALGIMLFAETIGGWPDYIAYFNFAAGGERGGLKLLGDSNLDWGQDLIALAKWQKEHGDVPLALAYFGNPPNDPEYYKIKYDELEAGPINTALAQTHVLAVSATRLQGIYPEPNRLDFSAYRGLLPTDVLGGTIYLYDLRSSR